MALTIWLKEVALRAESGDRNVDRPEGASQFQSIARGGRNKPSSSCYFYTCSAPGRAEPSFFLWQLLLILPRGKGGQSQRIQRSPLRRHRPASDAASFSPPLSSTKNNFFPFSVLPLFSAAISPFVFAAILFSTKPISAILNHGILRGDAMKRVASMKRILVVEDDLALSAGLCFELDTAGYTAIPAYKLCQGATSISAGSSSLRWHCWTLTSRTAAGLRCAGS